MNREMNFIRNLFLKRSDVRREMELDEVLADPLGIYLFADFVYDELSMENLLFYQLWVEWTEHFDERTEAERMNAATNIFMKHINYDSTYEMSLDSKE